MDELLFVAQLRAVELFRGFELAELVAEALYFPLVPLLLGLKGRGIMSEAEMVEKSEVDTSK